MPLGISPTRLGITQDGHTLQVMSWCCGDAVHWHNKSDEKFTVDGWHCRDCERDLGGTELYHYSNTSQVTMEFDSLASLKFFANWLSSWTGWSKSQLDVEVTIGE